MDASETGDNAEYPFSHAIGVRENLAEGDRDWYDVLANLHQERPELFPMDQETMESLKTHYATPEAAKCRGQQSIQQSNQRKSLRRFDLLNANRGLYA